MRLTTFVLILCCASRMSGQLNGKYNFKHLDQSDGLAHPRIKGIQQDKRGFIWILTQEGLQRFDGSRFLNYNDIIRTSTPQELQNANLYLDNSIDKIHVIKKNKMESLDMVTHRWASSRLSEIFIEPSGKTAKEYKGENQSHYQINEKGVIVYLGNTEAPFDANLNLNGAHYYRNTYCLKDSVTGMYWLHNYNHVLLADPSTFRVQSSGDRQPDYPLLKQLKTQFGDTNVIRFLLMDSQHQLWISTWGHTLCRYDFETQRLFRYSLKEIKKREEDKESGKQILLINAMFEDRQHHLWIATDNAGLLIYNRVKDDFDFITSDVRSGNTLKYNFSIYCIFQDRDDNIWIGTDRGISIFNPYKNQLQVIRHLEGISSTLSRNDITDVIETTQGEILVSTWGGGITIFDTTWNFKRNVLFQGYSDQNLIWSFIQQDDGTIWAGAQHGYIHIYHPGEKSFTNIRPPETGFFTIRVMAKDKEGNVLLGMHNGKITMWDKKTHQFYRTEDVSYTEKAKKREIVNILVDDQNRCWVATGSCLKEFDIRQRRFTGEFVPDDIDPSIGITVEGIENYDDSTLVIASVYHGIYLFDKNKHTFTKRFPLQLPEDFTTHAIKKDRDGSLWISSNFGMYTFQYDFTRYTHYLLDHSILQDALNHHRFYEMKDGRWITFSSAELICFHPGQMDQLSNHNTSVQICGFKIFNEYIPVDSLLLNTQPIILPYDQNFITVEFASPEYFGFKQSTYAYRLSGIDKSWIEAETKKFAAYTDIKPGTYLFEVKNESNSGSSPITSFTIVVNPHWWGTIWFRAIWVLSIVALGYGIIRKRFQNIRKESVLKHRIAETEMMALRAQMNPHFIFNCINGIDAMIQSNDKYKATMYLNKFARLIRNVLENSKENKIPLSKDLETLQLYIDLELFRHHDKFSVTIEADEELLQNDYTVPPLIVQPFVENAILHGLRHKKELPGILKVTVIKKNEQIIYIIEDNGVGRKGKHGNDQMEARGYGMQMSNDRIRLFNNEEIASIRITDLLSEGKPQGTRIEVKLNIQ